MAAAQVKHNTSLPRKEKPIIDRISLVSYISAWRMSYWLESRTVISSISRNAGQTGISGKAEGRSPKENNTPTFHYGLFFSARFHFVGFLIH